MLCQRSGAFDPAAALSIRALTAFISTLTSPTEIPCEAVRALCAVFAIDSSVFEGTQPVHVQSPPMRAWVG